MPTPTNPNEAYEVARQFTDDSVRRDVRYTIPADKMGEIAPFLSPLGSIGFQPISIAAHPTEPDTFAIANYFAPAIVFIKIVVTDDGGLELKKIGGIGRSIQPSGKRLRLFPSQVDDGSDGKRIQTLAFHPDRPTELLIARAGETDGLFRLVQTGENEWHTLPNKLIFEGDHPADHYIEDIATVLRNHYIYIARSKQDGSNSWLEIYDLDGKLMPNLIVQDLPPKTPWIEGIAIHDGYIYYSTGSWNGLKVPPGIYRGDELVVPDICGNGLAFLADGSLLITQYNDGLGDLGSPGYIYRVPAAMLEGK